MFEELHYGGTPRDDRAIVVQTSQGTSLKNTVFPPIDPLQAGFYRAVRRKYGAGWLNRKPAVGGYNCAGMVWANRRTALTEPEDWETILREDGYRRLDREMPLGGDIVIYRGVDQSEILHVARIVSVERRKTGELIAIWALSKWSATYGEDFHRVQDVYAFGGESYTTEFWTERTPEERETPELIV